MKRFTALVMVFSLVCLLPAGGHHRDRDEDIRAIKKAVKENPKYSPDVDAKWFKVVITDLHARKDKLRITLPISLVEFFMRCVPGEQVNINCEEYDIDLKKILEELKELGPNSLIEISDEDEILKIWLE